MFLTKKEIILKFISILYDNIADIQQLGHDLDNRLEDILEPHFKSYIVNCQEYEDLMGDSKLKLGFSVNEKEVSILDIDFDLYSINYTFTIDVKYLKTYMLYQHRNNKIEEILKLIE